MGVTVALYAVTACTGRPALLPAARARGGEPFTAEHAVVAAIERLPLDADATGDDLAPLRAAIGQKRIVLLGENGHGAAEFSSARVSLVRELHERMGFDIVAFESGFHECREADGIVGREPAVMSLQRCLIVQSQHAELLPLFEYVARTRLTERPLSIAGIDLQIQTYYSRSRPGFLREQLRGVAPALGDSIAALDSTLIEKTFQPPDSLARWLRPRAAPLRRLYEAGAALTIDDARWTFLAGAELVRREELRLAARDAGREVPAKVYEIRDEWMARTIARLAGGAHGRHKVVVLLHNDHARYGEWMQGDLHVRSTGQVLRALVPNQTYAIGALMGGGAFADNARRRRLVAAAPPNAIESVFARSGVSPAFLRLSNASNAVVREWAAAVHPYLRGGEVLEMRPGLEFDAVIYFRQVSPASFLLRFGPK